MDYNRERLRELHEKAAQKEKFDRQISQLRDMNTANADMSTLRSQVQRFRSELSDVRLSGYFYRISTLV